ncbi:MAG TPA: class I SAM-dependent methyltransferase [Dongiaceae bacterium]|nr:class I SAM-dependent methyltransferase [Dongiaceae bacterium]
MTTPITLTAAPLAPLLQKLFADAAATAARMETDIADLSEAELAEMMRSKTDYRALYARAKEYHLAVSPETARLLYMLARSMGARHIVEFGTSFGISTLHLAAALRDNGGGHLISSELEPSKAAAARANIAAAGLSDLVEIREGDALQTLARDLPAVIDLVLLDGAKGLYPDILDLLEPRLRPGALILADNANWSPDYLARVRSAQSGYLSIPVAADIELSLRLG